MKKKILSLLVVAAIAASSSAVFADTTAETTDEVVATSEATEVVEETTEAVDETAETTDEATISVEDIDVVAETETVAPVAEANQVKVFVDDTLILFADQQPLIKDDFTLVPARGVFEAMNNKVSWDGDTRTVTINSANNLTRIVLKIDNNTMSVYHFTSIMNADLTEITLEVAPQIINDRTMIPLRAISEALGTTVNWDGENYEVHIVTETEDAEAGVGEDAEEAKKVEVSLTADKTEVKEGEEVTLSMNVKNLSLYPDTFVSAVTASVSYDKNNFELVDAYLTDAEGNKITGDTGANNPDYTEDSLKTVQLTIDPDSAMKEDGTVLKLVFKAKNTAESNFALVDRYNSKLGHDLTILVSTLEDYTNTLLEGKDLVIDTTPVTVNAAEKADTEEVVDADVVADADADAAETDADAETSADAAETDADAETSADAAETEEVK